MKIISIRKNSEFWEKAANYFQSKWGNENTQMLYKDCIKNSLNTKNPLPQWYLLIDNDEIVGGAGLITNDFISRMDLYPWLCALYIEEKYRGKNLGNLLINQAKKDCEQAGFQELFLCTDHEQYYEKYGFKYIGDGYHPWGEKSRIYSISI